MATKVKTSIRVDEELLKEFKKLAKEDCLNVSAWIEAKIREYIERRKQNDR